MIRILEGDCREVMATLPEASVDAIVCDPPYELGFMGKGWDATGVANDPATWAAALRVLKPGGHLLAFSGTRTYHRMVCAIEDAGFEIRDQIGFAYGSGFPKSRNGPWGGTALKPAWEPICMARKPLIGTVEANWRAHGTGALNIDGCRVGDTVETWPTSRNYKPGNMREPGSENADALKQSAGVAPSGRWPANIIHDGSEEVLAAFPQTTSGKQAAGGHVRNSDKTRNAYGAFEGQRCEGDVLYGDSGSAARFFYTAKASAHDRNDGLQGASRTRQGNRPGSPDPTGKFPDHDHRERGGNHHPTVKPTDLMRYLCRLVTPPGGTVLDPFMGSGSTLKAAELEGFNAIGIELDPGYIEIARRRIASDAPLFADVA